MGLYRQGSGGVIVVKISANNSKEFVSQFGVMPFLPLNELPALFPHVVAWILYLEKQAQESGRAWLKRLILMWFTGGLTAGYGVIVRRDCANNLRLLAHEFAHVAQYERLGREGFLQEYIQQIAVHGYLNALSI